MIFHDMGNIFTSLTSMSFRVNQRNNQDFNIYSACGGFRVRYKTPVGPLRVDFAYSINLPHFLSGSKRSSISCSHVIPPAAPGTLPSSCDSVPQSLSHFQFLSFP